MSWSYNPSQPTVPLNRVRFYVGDTDTNDQLVSDEEIALALADEGNNVYRASAAVCRALSLKFARAESLKDKESGVEDDSQKRSERYAELAKEYARKAGRAGVKPFAGGVSVSDKQTRVSDADRAATAFSLDLHHLPGTAPAGGGE